MLAPIAETFHSIQGEGYWQGTPMHFVRLAGCSVGKQPWLPSHADELDAAGLQRFTSDPPPLLPTGKPAWLCRTWDGRPFWCDTDFAKYDTREVEDLIAETRERHLCLTGGEPLVHMDLFHNIRDLCRRKGIMLHVETSGTIYLHPGWQCWIAVSPKFGCLESMFANANEIKLLVDAEFDPDTLPAEALRHQHVWVQPVNNATTIDQDNLKRCLELLERFPNWRLSPQLHKLLGLR